jgi:hypothetical protein
VTLGVAQHARQCVLLLQHSEGPHLEWVASGASLWLHNLYLHMADEELQLADTPSRMGLLHIGSNQSRLWMSMLTFEGGNGASKAITGNGRSQQVHMNGAHAPAGPDIILALTSFWP